MTDIKGIIFDKDGTLVDFNRTWFPVADRLALDAAGNDRQRADALLVAGGYDFATHGFVADSVIAAGTNADIVDLWHPGLAPDQRMAMIEKVDRFTAEEGGANPVALPGCREAIERLHVSGMQMAVATNDSTAGAEKTLASLNMAQMFAAAYGYDSVANPKPAPDIVRAFCDLTGLRPSQLAMVGDNGHDLAMARAGDCGLAIGVLSGTGTRESLEPLADMIIGSIVELPALLTSRAFSAKTKSP